MNHEKKSRHVQLETGKSYCENTGESQTLEEYISDQQNITLEESKELIKNFYSLDKFSKKIRVPVEFLERLDISLIENKIRIVNKFEKVYIINKGSLHFSKMIKNACENLPYEKIYIIDLFSNQDEKSLNLENIHTFAKKISQEKYNEYVGIKEPLLFDNIVKPTIEKMLY